MNRMTGRLVLFAFAACFGVELEAKGELDPEGLRFFETKIRPVLAGRCYTCHSAGAASAGKLKGKLRLDTRAGVLGGGESGPAIVAGKPEDSLLIRALRREGPEMPPKDALRPEVIADFVKWVKMGAPDPREGVATVYPESRTDVAAGRTFWSFRPLRDITVPTVNNGAWARTDVDRHILARQDASGVTPGGIADRRTLIRRAYFDLLGLPPTRDEVERFERDRSPDAYGRLIDRLLGSVRHGERWARHWLDLARFAESNGYAFDKDREGAFHYRDFVIRAFNEDMPYDEFVRLQVAGDLTRPDDQYALAATGFLVAGPYTTQQTAKERERSRYEQLDDVVSTLGVTTLGLSLGCARCHDHKYDPVPSYDYYRMISAFAEMGFKTVGLDLHPEVFKKARAVFDLVHDPLVEARARYERDHLPGKLAAWEADRPEDQPLPGIGDWHQIGPFIADSFDLAFETAFAPEKKVDLERGAGERKWKAEPGWKDGVVHNTLKGDNAANYLYRTIKVEQDTSVEVSLGRNDAIRLWLNGQQVLSQKVMGVVAPDQDRVTFALRAGRNDVLMKIVNSGGPSGFYFKMIEAGPPGKIREILALPAQKRSCKQAEELLIWFHELDPRWRELNDIVVKSAEKTPKPQLTKIYSARDGGETYEFGDDTRKVYFLVRGDSNNKKGNASPGFLQVLTSSPEQERRWTVENESLAGAKKPVHPRVAMARWLTDTTHGAGRLLARVIVNRLWQHHFGRGIVATPSDFGAQGERPTHPGLLDFLARQLIDGDWRLKPLHRLIMTSSVYMQSGETTATNRLADPDNHLFWRQPARRFEAEVVRDTLLAVSGDLDTRAFGPGSLDQNVRRRSIYLTVKRGSLVPILQLFDAPDAIQSIGERSTTTVSPQALAMMNSSFVRDCARRFARRVWSDARTDSERVVEDAFWIALARPPAEDEVRRMVRLIDDQATSYGDAARARKLAVVDFCQLMMCLNEFVYVD